MGYNIGEVSGYDGGPSDWTLEVDLSDPSVTMVTGDFDVVSLVTGESVGEADSYVITQFSANFDTYTNNFVLNPDGTFSFDIDRQAVFQSGSDQTISFTILGTSGTSQDDDTVTITLLICVARGTAVQTDRGDIPVEDLSPGDRVRTLDDGFQPIRWVGSRVVSAAELGQRPDLRPVRISSGALGEGMPVRDLVVSPQHRVLVGNWRTQLFMGQDEVLVPAKGLVDGKSIHVDCAIDEVEYFHILFDGHQVIFTNGAATESFHPADYALSALSPDVRAELMDLFPDIENEAGFRSTARPVAQVQEARLLSGRQGAW